MVSQAAPDTEEPTVSTSDIPPAANPVASDMVTKNCWFAGSCSFRAYEPLLVPASKDESGSEILMGTLRN